ncbi:Endogenous retrovirus group K member 9 Pol protein [Bienertia sinuspersici]
MEDTYEGLRLICYHCGRINHKEEDCPNLHKHNHSDNRDEHHHGDNNTMQKLTFNQNYKKSLRRLQANFSHHVLDINQATGQGSSSRMGKLCWHANGDTLHGHNTSPGPQDRSTNHDVSGAVIGPPSDAAHNDLAIGDQTLHASEI